MIWIEQWRALAARIDGLVRVGEFLSGAFSVHSTDEFGIFDKYVFRQLEEVNAEIRKLGRDHQADIPTSAYDALQRYANNNLKPFAGASKGIINIQLLAPLVAFRSEFEYLIRDVELEQRNLVELAFEHLSRQIVVDEDVQKKWQEAFNTHETRCEKLGAVHLLGHGIWAFKVVAIGGATDLVFGNPVQDSSTAIRRAARTLVLTEWKLVKKENELKKKAEEALKQAEAYAEGVLGDIELKRTRYIVLVTKNQVSAIDDITQSGITYRHVTISVYPKVPSESAQSGSW